MAWISGSLYQRKMWFWPKHHLRLFRSLWCTNHYFRWHEERRRSVFVDKEYRRLFASIGESNGTEKIERYFKSLTAGVRAEFLLESGFTDYMWFDAAHVFCAHYNRLPTKASRVSDSESPFQSLGFKVGRRNDLCLFGSFGSRLDKKNGDLTAAELPGLPCIFIGYGTDNPGYLVILPDGTDLHIEIDRDVTIGLHRLLTRAFAHECRTDPVYSHLLPWVNAFFRPFDIVGILPTLTYPPPTDSKRGDFGCNHVFDDSQSEVLSECPYTTD